MRVRAAHLLAAALIACCASVGTAADYPNRPIHLYIGSNPAGSTDLLGRVLAKALAVELGQPVVVHNRTGAGGAVMAAQLKDAPADGYTLGFTISHAYTGSPALSPGTARYTVHDFTHLASVSKGLCALVTSTDKPYRTLADLIGAAKRGERPVFASQSPLTKVLVDYLAATAGVRFRVISVQGGGETMQAIVGGHADFAFSGGPHVDYVAAGRMRVLASAEDERLPTSPEVPTLKELGYAVSQCASFVVSAPRSLPTEVEDKLIAALSAAIDSPDMTALIARLRYPSYHLASAGITAALAAEATTLTRIVARVAE